MADDPSGWTSRRIYWGVVAVVFLAGTYILAGTWYGGDLEANVVWPEKWNWSSTSRIRVSVTDGDGRPISGGEVELGVISTDSEEPEAIAADILDEQWRRLATGTTGEEGQVWLKLPPGKEVFEGYDQIPAEPTVAIRATSGWGSALDGRRLAAPNRARLALSPDRSVYRPGETMRFRGMVFEPDGSGPVRPEEGQDNPKATLSIVEPGGNAIYREREVPSSDGLMVAEVQLAEQGPRGEYRAKLSYRGTETTRSVEVAPASASDFDVSLDASSTGGTDPTIRGSVEARYVYGEPVEGAEVELAVRAAGPGGRESRGTVTDTGALDGEGTYQFEVNAPRASGIGAEAEAWRVEADVVGTGGRRVSVSRGVQRVGPIQRVEVVPTEAPHFRAGERNEAVVLVRGRQGAPLADAEVVWEGPGKVATLESTTDAEGRARFEWQPPTGLGKGSEHQSSGLSPFGRRTELQLDVSAGEDASRSFATPASVVARDAVVPEPNPPAPVTGDEVELALDVGGNDEVVGERVSVVATHDGDVIGYTTVSVGSTDERPSGSLTLVGHQRGLAYLVVFSEAGGLLGRTAIWVRQKGGSTLEVEVEDQRQSGEKTTVSMTDPFDEQQRGGNTTFGVWAVDGATRRHHERTGLGFPTLLWHDPGSRHVASRAAAIAGAGSLEASEGNEWLAARLSRATIGHGEGFAAGASGFELNRAAASWSRQGWLTGWAVFMYLLLVVLAYAAVRLTSRQYVQGAFTWRRLAVFTGIFLAGVGLHALMLWMTQAFAGLSFARWFLALVAGVCLGLGFVQAHFRGPETGFRRWIALMVAQLVVLLSVVWTGRAAGETLLGIPGLLPISLAWLGVVIGEAIFWAASLLGRRLSWAFLGAASVVVGAVVAPTLVGVPLGTSGGFGVRWLFATPVQGREASTSDETPSDDRDQLERPDPSTYHPSTGDAPATGASPLWRPVLMGDVSGRVEVEMTSPGPETDWHLEAVAHDGTGRVASGTAALGLGQPYSVDVSLPERLRSGDRPEVPVTVVDRREQPESSIEVQLEFATDGTLELRERRQTLEVPAGEESVAYVSLGVDGTGTGRLEVRAGEPTRRGAEMEAIDADEHETEAVAAGRRIRRSQSGWVSEGWQTSFNVPLAAYPRSLSAHIDVLPGPVALAFDGEESIVGYPHERIDQVVSATYANVFALRSLEEIGAREWPAGEDDWHRTVERAERQLRRKYQKLLPYQQESGAFVGHTSESQKADVGFTAYALLQLAAIDDRVEVVDASRSVRRATQWLVEAQDADGSWSIDGNEVSEGGTAAKTALGVWAVARSPIASDAAERAVERGVEYVADRRRGDDELGIYARALAANALAEADRLKVASEMLDGLMKRRELGRGETYWVPSSEALGGGRESNHAIATTALVVRAVAAIKEDSEISRAAVRFLSGRRHRRGGWGAPKATIWSTEALTRSDIWQTDKPNLLKVNLDGTPMVGPEGNGAVRVYPGRSMQKRFEARDFFPGTRRFAVYPKIGGVSAIAQAHIRYVVPWETEAPGPERAPVDLDLEVSRREVGVAEPIEVTVTMENTAEEAFDNGLVHLPVPPGGWIDHRAGRTNGENVVQHLERRPTHLAAYVTRVDAGETRTFRYTVRPRVAGRYRLPPVRAAEFDDTRLPALGEAGPIRVEGE